MKIYGTILSPNVRKVIVALNLKNLEHEQIQVRPGTKTPEFLAISPLGLIPAFEDGELAISDSSIIIEYLDEQYPDTPILPTDPQDRARSRWLEEYGGSVLFPCCAAIFLERIANPLFFKQSTDENRVEEAINNKLPPVLDYLEVQVPSSDFFFGELGIADIAVVSPLINSGYADYRVDERRWPKLAAFIKRVVSHPAFVKALDAEQSIVAALKEGELSAA